MHRLPLCIASLMALLPLVTNAAPADAWRDARQLVLVTIADWNASRGELRRFERNDDGIWHAAAPATPVTIGRAGAAWGLGLHEPQTGAQKREGDGRSPAGVFRIGHAFGYASTAKTALVYQPQTADDWCIDVNESPLYNQIVNRRRVGDAAIAGSTEPMRRDLHLQGDQRYRIGFVIQHNPGNRSAAGSCIFAHLWKSPDAATAGCTAMDDTQMRDLLGWLVAARTPVFVLLPRDEYQRLATTWALPAE